MLQQSAELLDFGVVAVRLRWN